MKSITLTIELTYYINVFPEYYQFWKDKHLYNTKTGKRLKQCYNNGSIGYWLNGTFLSLKKIKPLLCKPKDVYCPF